MAILPGNRYPYSEPLSLSSGAADIAMGNLTRAAAQRYQLPAGFGQVFLWMPTTAPSNFSASTLKNPILATYQKNFSRSVSKPENTMPPQLSGASTLSPGLFLLPRLKCTGPTTWKTPEVFYNREDLWRFPERVSDGVATAAWSLTTSSCGCPISTEQNLCKFCPSPPRQIKTTMVAWMAGGSSTARIYGNLFAVRVS